MTKSHSNLILDVIQSTFKKSADNDLEKYLSATGNIKKWSCFSDYCFGDKSKPNDVVCFTMIPYIDDFQQLSSHIKSLANVDIKNTRKVNEEFTSFMRNYPLINFSFILNDKKNLFGNDSATIKKSLELTFTLLKQQYITWAENEPEKKEHYKEVEKKIDRTLLLIQDNKKIKQIIEMVLVTFLGAYVSSIIINKTKAEIFGWFSDRDSLNEVSEMQSIDLFHNYLHGFSNMHNFHFVAAPATSKDKPFYEDLLKIPDYIAGALADYNMQDNLISKDKFNTMLTNYMAGNTINNFIFQLKTENGFPTCSRVTIHAK